MTWDSFHRRGAVLRDVVAEADRRRDGRLPGDVPGVAETFDGEFDLLATLQLRWHTRLAGQVERALSERPGDPEQAVVTAWRRAAADLAGVRAILDRAASDPGSTRVRDMVGTARRNEWTMLAVTAGLASGAGPAAARVGRELEEQARAAGPLPGSTAGSSTGSSTGSEQARDQGLAALLRRLRSHLAA